MSSSSAKVSPLKDFLAGGFGGVCLVVSGHPFDTIKVRLQTSSNYNGMLDCIKQIWSKEGPKGYFKGMLAPIAGVAPMYALCFLGFSTGMKMQGYDEPGKTSPVGLFAAGTVAGFYTTAIMAPGERIKCLLQIQGATGATVSFVLKYIYIYIYIYRTPQKCAKLIKKLYEYQGNG